MHKTKINRILSGILTGFLLFASFQAFSDEPNLLLLAAADEQRSEAQELPSGTLVLPVAAEEKEAEKKCMTVCQKWGQDCVYDNQRGRKCRRTCKQFGQECF